MKNIFGRLLGNGSEDKGRDVELLQAELSFYQCRSDDWIAPEMEGAKQGHVFCSDFILRVAKIKLDTRVSLRQEVDLLSDYIDCYRYMAAKPDELYVRFNAQLEEEALIPAFILFPLVQNALRYGYNSLEAFPLKITIKQVANSLTLEVSNRVNHNIVSQQECPELLNYKARLAVYFPDNHFLVLNSNSHTFKATLRIKL